VKTDDVGRGVGPAVRTAVGLSVKPARSVATGEVGPATSDMPISGPLVDTYGRVHRDLRVSVTDRCNLRCVYCMPENMTFMDRRELMSFEEIARVVRVARGLGVTSVRLTGGEPLVRRGLADLVAMIAAAGIEDISLTTNGVLLSAQAQSLKAAGLTRVNISCDSLRPERFAAIRRRGNLSTVLEAMDVAEGAGLAPLKVNVVLLRGQNDDEIEDFAALARETGRVVRFIEFMPLDAQGEWQRERLVTGREVLARINERWPLHAVEGSSHVAPAERFRFDDGRGEIGLISSVSEPFCGTCDRLRLTAEGSVRNCLFSDDELSVRDVLRGSSDDEAVATLLRRAVWAKFPGHAINEENFLAPRRSMSMIGG